MAPLGECSRCTGEEWCQNCTALGHGSSWADAAISSCVERSAALRRLLTQALCFSAPLHAWLGVPGRAHNRLSGMHV